MGLDQDTIFSVFDILVDIAAKKIPSEINFAATKIDSVASKIKLVPVPKQIQETEVSEMVWDDAAGQEVKRVIVPKNTEERAIVRLRIPIRTVEVEEVHVDPETLEEVKEVVMKDVEQDVEDKTLMVSARVDALPYSVYLLNQSVPRQHRHEVFSHLRKNYADHFSQH
jgi:hypothetical protein